MIFQDIQVWISEYHSKGAMSGASLAETIGYQTQKFQLYGHRKFSSIYMCWYKLINSLQCLSEMALGQVI